MHADGCRFIKIAMPYRRDYHYAFKMTPLQADTYRQFGRHGTALVLQGFLQRRTFRPVITMRWCQISRRKGFVGKLLLPFCKVLHKFATHLAGMDFPWSTQIGPGLALTHGWALVVNAGATIGSNVTLFHGVTLGRRDRILPDGRRDTSYPVIEDDVWIGPHAVIVGGVRIGCGSRIGAGAFVTEDVPPYSVVVGNPGRIVKSACTPDVSNRAPVESTVK
jgi:serine O-acetyltransferase